MQNDVSTILLLSTAKEYIEEVASIYFQQWGWHYSEDWNIKTKDSIIQDLQENCLDSTYILVADNKSLIGTVALLNEDLRSHMHLGPWLTCLYVYPQYRNKGYGQTLLTYAMHACPSNTIYLWSYAQETFIWYQKHGWVKYEEIKYNGRPAYILFYTKEDDSKKKISPTWTRTRDL